MVGLWISLTLVGIALLGMEFANPTGYLGALGGASIASGLALFLGAPAGWALGAFFAALLALSLYFKSRRGKKPDGRKGQGKEKGV
jgi:membrane protein implicated in regulation of membrane protease activity